MDARERFSKVQEAADILLSRKMSRCPTREWLHGVQIARCQRPLAETFGKERRTMTRAQRMAAVITGVVITAVGSGIGFYNYKRTLPSSQSTGAVVAPAIADVPLSAPTPALQVTTTCNDRQYTVIKGDNLTRIAIAQWGRANAFQWRKIWHENRGSVKNPNLIYPGQVLSISDCIAQDDSLPARSVKPRTASRKKHVVTRTEVPHIPPATDRESSVPTPSAVVTPEASHTEAPSATPPSPHLEPLGTEPGRESTPSYDPPGRRVVPEGIIVPPEPRGETHDITDSPESEATGHSYKHLRVVRSEPLMFFAHTRHACRAPA